MFLPGSARAESAASRAVHSPASHSKSASREMRSGPVEPTEPAVAEQVDSVVVAQSTQRTRLGDELGLLWELLVAKTRDVGIGLTDELVAQTDLVEYAVVHGDDELVGRGPAHVVDIGQTRIVPAACGLVGGKALHVPQCTHVLAETAVDARDVGIAVGAVRRRTCQTLIALGKQLLIGVLRGAGCWDRSA